MRIFGGLVVYRRLLYGPFVSSRECTRVVQLIEFARASGMTTIGEAEILKTWAERVDSAAPHIAAPVEPVRDGVRLPGTKRRGPTKKERERAAREDEQRRKVEAWHGPRKLLPGELEKMRDYEPNNDR